MFAIKWRQKNYSTAGDLFSFLSPPLTDKKRNDASHKTLLHLLFLSRSGFEVGASVAQ